MSGLRFVLRLAWRESRAAHRRLLFLASSIALGVAALVALDSFTDNLRRSVAEQARTLLGADLALSSRQQFSPRVTALFDSLGCARGQAPCGAVARVTGFSAMAYIPRTAGARLVQVSAVEEGYPFYGEIRTDPATAWRGLQGGRHAIVDPSLLTALGARVGDTLALGETRFVVSGTVLAAPGDVGIRSAFGPRVFIPARFVDETGLLGFGSRAEYEAFVKLADPGAAQGLADRYRVPLREERVRIRTVAENQENLTETLSQLARYLSLVALIALLLGGLGVASAVHAFIRRKLETVAVLRCLGTPAWRIVAAYLVQAAALGLLGSLAGAAIGAAVQYALPIVLRDFLPVGVSAAPSLTAIGIGLLTGLWISLVFALLPLLSIRLVPPLAALRRTYEPERRPRDRWRIVAYLVLAASVVVLAAVQARNWRNGLFFAGGIGTALLVLWLAALGLVRAVRRWFPSSWPYLWRQGLANLYRPANQTVTVVLAVGFGAFLLGTLLLVQHNLLRPLRVEARADQPNLVLFDIQADQRAGVESVLRSGNYPVTGPVAIVPMRIAAVRGRPVTELLRDTTLDNAWALRREYRSTHRDTLVRSEQLVAGRWWPDAPPRDRALYDTRISIERDLAADLGVGVGDEIVWDVQGSRLRSRITSVREVDWARFEPNFFVVFEPGALDRAPQTLVLLTRIPSPAERGAVQRRLAERFPNVTSLDLSMVQSAIETLVDRVALAIRFMALFSLGTGAIVLVGAIATNRYQRLREGALLRTIGATRRQVFRIAFAEYLSLGALAAAVALVLATAAGWALARFVFDSPFALPVPPLSVLAVAVVAGCVVVGLANSREVVRRTPLEVLREE